MGYRQQKEDDRELVEDEEELERLRLNLSEATTSLCAAHAALTAAWGQPLSLFRREFVKDEGWPLEVVEGARDLVEKAAELEDLADVYDAQLQLAISQHRSLLRTPLRSLETKLDDLSLVLTSQISAVVLAKEVFEGAKPAKPAKPVHAIAAIHAAQLFCQARCNAAHCAESLSFSKK